MKLICSLIAIATFAAPIVQAGPMQHAAQLTQEAHDVLQNGATTDKGGHRVAAMKLLKQALAEINAGMEFDKANVTANEGKKRKKQ
jgi:hypothetical protein